jgi:hypothetical protein
MWAVAFRSASISTGCLMALRMSASRSPISKYVAPAGRAGHHLLISSHHHLSLRTVGRRKGIVAASIR